MRSFAKVLACLLAALAASLLASASASAKTFVASPSVADTKTAPTASECTNASPCALRQAVTAAEAAEEATAENEKVELPVGTYILTQGPLHVSHPTEDAYSLTIVGLGVSANETVITAEGKSRVLVDGWDGGTSGQVVLKRLEITSGNGEGGVESEELFEPQKGEGGGIAIEQNGTLSLDEVLITANTAASAGGGVEDFGELTVEDSTIAHNVVSGGLGVGGGISSENPDGLLNHDLVTVVNSTIADNSVSGGSTNEGGAVYNGSELKLTNSTIAGNSAPGTGGGGLASAEGTGIGQSKLADDVFAYDKGNECAGTAPTSAGGNDFEGEICESKANAQTNKDVIGDPELELESSAPKLAENGGPTPTIRFQSASSPAIGIGLSNCPEADQRGYPRPSTGCDAGAYQHEEAAVTISGTVSPVGTGTLDASSQIKGAKCSGADCSVPKSATGVVTLAAEPDGSYEFKEWLSCENPLPSLHGTAVYCEEENTGETKAVTAVFEKLVTISGDVEPTGAGTITASSQISGADCRESSCEITQHAPGKVKLKAEAESGYVFKEWKECADVKGSECELENTGANKSATAVFEALVTISGSASPAAGGSVTAKSTISGAKCTGASCIVASKASGVVSFTESASSEYGFTGWSGCSKITAGACEVENVGSDHSVLANFKSQYTIAAFTDTKETTVTASATSGPCSDAICIVEPGETVTLEAKSSNQALHFKEWSGGSCETQNPCKLEHAFEDQSYTAEFEGKQSETTFTVTTLADTSPGVESACTGAHVSCSLRQAIADADASSAPKVIIDLAKTGSYKVTEAGLEILPHESTSQIEILGNGKYAGETRVDAEERNRVLEIGEPGKPKSYGPVTLKDLRVEGGRIVGSKGYGGGIYVEEEAQLILQESSVAKNKATVGGGIYAKGRLELQTSSVYENVASASGGGIYNADTAGELQANGVAVINDSTIAKNTASEGEGLGGGIYNDAELLLSNSGIAENTAKEGAGFYQHSTGWAVNTVIAANHGADCAPTGTAPFLTEQVSGHAESGYDIDDDGTCDFGALHGGISDSKNLKIYSFATEYYAKTPAIHFTGANEGAAATGSDETEEGLKADCTASTPSQSGWARSEPCAIGPYEPHGFYDIIAAVTGGNGQVSASSNDGECSQVNCYSFRGATVELKATPDEGFMFKRWTGGSCREIDPCKIDPVDAGEEDKAEFVPGPTPAKAGTTVLYVSEKTGNDNNSGTSPAQPFKTLPNAVRYAEDVAEHQSSHGGTSQPIQILLAEGSYEGTTLDELPNLSIYGGLNSTFQSTGGASTIAGSPQALLIEHSPGVRLQNLTLTATATEEEGSTGSVYGVRIIDGSSVVVAEDEISTGYALEGANGSEGVRGALGHYGVEGAEGETSGKAAEYFGSTNMTPGGPAGLSPNGTLYGTEYSYNQCYGYPCQQYGNPNTELQEPGDGGAGGYGYDSTIGQGGSSSPGNLGKEVYGCWRQVDGANSCGIAHKYVCVREGEQLSPVFQPYGACDAEPELVTGGFYQGVYETPYVSAETHGSPGATSFGCLQSNCKYAALAGGAGGAQGQYVAEDVGGKTEPGEVGGTGAEGEAGATGASGKPESGAPSVTEWDGATGVGGEGQTGMPGSGGGGGGGGSGANYGLSWANAAGDGGGGGGSGGTGGTGGMGGRAGGGAFGVFVGSGSKAVLELGSKISAGNGGTGGNGGDGGAGGWGGLGGLGNKANSGEVGAGGNGGSGGGGGAGGGGGGGVGGPSDAVYTDGTSSVETGEGVQLQHGQPGAGGLAGGAGAKATAQIRAAEGTAGGCSGACSSNTSLPVLTSPVIYETGGVTFTIIACSSSCSGTLILTISPILQKHIKTKPLALIAATGAGKLVGKVKFTAKAGHHIKVKIKLSSTALRLLEKEKMLELTQKLTVKLGKSKKPNTYTSNVVLSSHKPTPSKTSTK
jgi:Divergent InlB B-repeat domain